MYLKILLSGASVFPLSLKKYVILSNHTDFFFNMCKIQAHILFNYSYLFSHFFPASKVQSQPQILIKHLFYKKECSKF